MMKVKIMNMMISKMPMYQIRVGPASSQEMKLSGSRVPSSPPMAWSVAWGGSLHMNAKNLHVSNSVPSVQVPLATGIPIVHKYTKAIASHCTEMGQLAMAGIIHFKSSCISH